MSSLSNLCPYHLQIRHGTGAKGPKFKNEIDKELQKKLIIKYYLKNKILNKLYDFLCTKAFLSSFSSYCASFSQKCICRIVFLLRRLQKKSREVLAILNNLFEKSRILEINFYLLSKFITSSSS